MAGREHEAIAIEPARIGGIVAEMPGPEHVGEGSERHRSAGVARVRLLNGIHGKDSDRVDAEIFERLARCRWR